MRISDWSSDACSSDLLELQLEELEASATQDELAAEAATAKTQTVRSCQRQRPLRKPFPDDIERERVVIAAPTSCSCSSQERRAGTECVSTCRSRWSQVH